MQLNMKQYRCGKCGGDTFMLYNNIGENFLNHIDQTSPEGIIVECEVCGSTSGITITEPKMKIVLGDEDSKGCIYITE